MSPATAQPLKLEVGRSYRTRDGRKVSILGQSTIRDFPLTGDNGQTYNTSGQSHFALRPWENDLIAEWDAPATPKQEQSVDEKLTIECLFECFANWSDARQAGEQEGMKKAAAEAQRFFDDVNDDDLAQPLALALRGLLDDISVSGWLGQAATLREATEAMERAKTAGVL